RGAEQLDGSSGVDLAVRLERARLDEPRDVDDGLDAAGSFAQRRLRGVREVSRDGLQGEIAKVFGGESLGPARQRANGPAFLAEGAGDVRAHETRPPGQERRAASHAPNSIDSPCAGGQDSPAR